MAKVILNPNGTYTVTVTAKEQRALKRAADEPVAMTSEKKLEDVITGQIQSWYQDFLSADGPTRLVKFDALNLVKQDQVDAILNGA